MYVDMNLAFLLLMAMLVALLSVELLQRTGAKGWLALGALLLVCAGTNPSMADHASRVRQRAGAGPVRGTSRPTDPMAQFRNGRFETISDYRNLGVASAVVIQGKILSFGVLGEIWVVDLQRLTLRLAHENNGPRP